MGLGKRGEERGSGTRLLALSMAGVRGVRHQTCAGCGREKGRRRIMGVGL